MKIYRTTDRIPVKIADLTFWFSPMTWAHKSEIVSLTQREGGEVKVDGNRVAFLTLKYSLKAIEGLKCADGSDYVFDCDSDGIPTDETINDLFQLDTVDKLVTVAASWLSKIRPIELSGVTVDFDHVQNTKKKTT